MIKEFRLESQNVFATTSVIYIEDCHTEGIQRFYLFIEYMTQEKADPRLTDQTCRITLYLGMAN